MDAWLIVVRIIHVGCAMMWFGGAIIGSFFLQPTAGASRGSRSVTTARYSLRPIQP